MHGISSYNRHIVFSKQRAVNKSDPVEKIGSLSSSRVKQIIEGVKLLIEPREI